MAIPKINKLSLTELEKLQKNVAQAIEEAKVRKRKEALAAAEAAVKRYGYTLSELNPAPARKAKTPPPKYRHPDNSSLTWSGRGRQPAWIKEGLEAGASLEDYSIK